MVPKTDLSRLLEEISPQLHPGTYVFCELAGRRVPEGLEVQLLFQEDEATTVVVTAEQAAVTGLRGVAPSAWITLGVDSDLDAVGFLAVVAARLAAAGISVNVVSAILHDHLFVPIETAERAMEVLIALGRSRETVPICPPAKTTEGIDVVIRPVRLTDGEALMALWETCGLHFEASDVLVSLRSSIRLHGELILVASAGPLVVGSLWATYDGRRGWIQRLASAPSHRGHGIAHALVTEAERRLTRLGATKVNLLIDPDNPSAVGFYKRLGYREKPLLFMEHCLPSGP
jgi:ribosomal protein S18 acetylase RimI-like enzyme